MIQRFLSAIEWAGNLLPHPVTLFALFAMAIVIISAITARLGVSVEDPRSAEGVLLTTRSLLSDEGVRWMLQSMVTNFTGFVPLGTVLVALLGVGVAEKSGLFSAATRGLVLAAPPNLVTVVLVFAGVVSNTASEMGYVVLIPLSMTLFHALGRHPLAGMAAAFAGVSGGYSANLLIGTIDPLLAGITQEAARLVEPGYEVHAAVNWYFMIVSTFLITALGWFVTARIVEPRLGKYDDSMGDDTLEPAPEMTGLTREERRALKGAGWSALLVCSGFMYMVGPRFTWLGWAEALPLWGVLRDPDTTLTGPDSFRPLLHSVVPMILVFFVVPGFVYGRLAGTMKNDKDVIDAMAAAMKSMGLYIVLVFFAAQFVAYFNYSGLGQVVAVLGAEALVAMQLDNPLVFIPFIAVCAMVNLVIASASAKWAVLAPVFVPMLMTIGYSPEVIQTAYRIGDSCTNIITPMMSYFGLILAVAVRYKKDLGIGTMIATMLPYTIAFLAGWTLLFYLWVFLLDMPVGPGAATYYTPAPAG
ncbi:MAG: AbgT family transporter [Leptolyngbya sp. PLA3]|nr:MAG: AbgT family transporter [Cyanobacteria bacterium CYA]MCE7969747.1 AbgT family transporter [Leptolyngbya sp. PL-A3]